MGHRQSHKSQGGFTLIELSIVLVIIALITGMSISMGLGMVETARRVQTASKLDTIENALMSYRTVYNRLPCPANAFLLPTNASYGLEAANTGTCTGGTPAANFSDTTHNVVEGAVPFKALNLPEEFMYDGWGRKFAYAVNKLVTASRAMASMSLTEQCGISVTDAGGVAGNRTSGSLYSLVSFGADGHGGYTKTGTRVNASSTNVDELTNCHCNSSAVATTYAANYVQKEATRNPASSTDVFDDIVRFKERWQMMTLDDPLNTGGSVCSLGFRIDGLANRDIVITHSAVGDVNGDGLKDLILAAQGIDGYGHVYVIFGRSSWPSTLSVGSLDGTNGFELHGIPEVDWYSQPMTRVAVGDINGDGIDDIFIIQYTFHGYSSAFVIFGHSGAWTASSDELSLADGTHGTQLAINGDFGDGGSFDSPTMAVGDINKDGKVDILMGSPRSTPASNGYAYAGVVRVYFGHTGAWSATTDIGTLNGTNGFEIDGSGHRSDHADYFGSSIAVGDINGDNIKDLVIGASNQADGAYGSAYFIFGKTGAWTSPVSADTLADGTRGSRFDDDSGGNYGSVGMLAATGDLNGDGIADAYVGGGITYTDIHGFIIFGHSGAWSNHFSYTTLAGSGSKGFYLDDADGHGSTDAVFADLNGDGTADLILGCGQQYYNCDGGGTKRGTAYVIYGKASGWPQSFYYAQQMDGTQGFLINGIDDNSYMGQVVMAADVTGDNVPELMVGSPYASPGGVTNAGSLYTLYRRTSWPASYDLSIIH
ncbi:prepilin-type N-terminal cleavage/methylation domain-containing protein [Paludisphaera borealis]|uniref:Type II secretion system protein G n=1 Tax=Paludisphaera borealis TaxID=1387353 RepID=A0A1U7CI48_9BACT|nr:prepilin-type N-terminal cleavage/methylation domain-containing protein [Paludisphaera borealis]APW58615.1 hypothetical protein BSF38_00013 [Paludisphaera borealis]